MVVDFLEAEHVEYVLIGGYALVLSGLVRYTGNVDVLVRNTPENNRRWIAALSRLPDGAASELAGIDDPFPTDEDPEVGPGVIRVFDEFVVDVMPKACGLTYEQLVEHIRPVQKDGQTIRVLTMEGLLLTKQTVRPKDMADREQLEIALDRERRLRDGTPGPTSWQPDLRVSRFRKASSERAPAPSLFETTDKPVEELTETNPTSMKP